MRHSSARVSVTDTADALPAISAAMS